MFLGGFEFEQIKTGELNSSSIDGCQINLTLDDSRIIISTNENDSGKKIKKVVIYYLITPSLSSSLHFLLEKSKIIFNNNIYSEFYRNKNVHSTFLNPALNENFGCNK